MITGKIREAIPLFAGLTDANLSALVAAGHERKAASGEVLFQQDSAGDASFVMLEGVVRLHQQNNDCELELARVGPGGFFGEMALIDGSPRCATATVVEDASLFVLDRQVFLDLLTTDRQILSVVLAWLVGNLRHSDAHRSELVHQQKILSMEAEMARLRTVSQMVAGVAHEINTPLGIIVNAASVIEQLLPALKNARDPETLEDLTTACALILKNAEHGGRLVSTFRSLSVRQVTHAHETLALTTLLREVLDLFQIEARKLKLVIQFTSDLPPGADIWDGIPGHLTQILLNLLSNIGRYAYPAGVGGNVEVRLAAGEIDQFVITVADYGAGIEEKNLPRIFDPFFTTGRDKDGVGLGLAIVHETVTAGLGGRIAVTSRSGEGTRFTIHLPQRVPTPAPNPDSTDA
jgi:signal transduction histidine kinase